MITLITITHIVVCVFLVGIVLLQHGKGADMGASFGGGSSQTVFGSDGPLPLLNKVTTGGAIIFMITSLTLAYHSAHLNKGSVMKAVQVAPMSTPAANKTPLVVPMPKAKSGGNNNVNPFTANKAQNKAVTRKAVSSPSAPAALPAQDAKKIPQDKNK
ncbi:MAG TPA: preprotein translocase subunit SecG [Desulfobacterales bacterium]|nr:preprotein translocase subunit SecG [Desulfobacterales bacterium]